MKQAGERSSQPNFNNTLINKRQLKQLMYDTFLNYGIVKSSIIADRLKNLTFHYATKSGISLSIEDLRVPHKKLELIGLTNNEVDVIKTKYNVGSITEVERFQKTIDIWNNANNFLKDEVLTYFRESDPLNPLYIMAFSGARGNISQVRQLVGMRGLMADPQGQIIDLPIRSNFREGLTVTEYIISSYGARKGLVDTAIRTADSGYLTRRLVDVAQDIIIREEDCGTKDGITAEQICGSKKVDPARLIGRLLAQPLSDDTGQILKSLNSELTPQFFTKIKHIPLDKLRVRSPLTCNSSRSICRNCYGWNLAYSQMADLGDAVGIIAAQSIGEPGTQLTMRTFHTGGVFSGDLTSQIRAPYKGTVFYSTNISAALFRTLQGEKGFLLSEPLIVTIVNADGTQTSITVPSGGVLLVNTQQRVYANEIIAEVKKETNVIVDEAQKDILAEESGELYYRPKPSKINPTLNLSADLIANKARRNLIWVLYGKIYFLPYAGGFTPRPGTFLDEGAVLKKSLITNKYPGTVSLNLDAPEQSIEILHQSIHLQNLYGHPESGQKYKFGFHPDGGGNEVEFDLQVMPNTVLQNGDTIGVLNDGAYRTETGGIIVYNIEKTQTLNKKNSARKLFSGSIYWIPEETYRQDVFSDFDRPFVSNGSIIKAGMELFPGVVSKKGGLVQINVTEQELVVKPGELINLTNLKLNGFNKTNRFIKAGDTIIPHRIFAQELVYLEFFKFFEFSYLLIRPVKRYVISKEKSFSLKQLQFPPLAKPYLNLKMVKRVFYKNWERVRTHESVDLLKTFLIVDFTSKVAELQPKLQLISNLRDKKNTYGLKIALSEIIKFNNRPLKNLDPNLKVNIHSLAHNKQYVGKKTILGFVETRIQQSGILGCPLSSKNELLVLENRHLKIIAYDFPDDKLQVKVGDLIRSGTLIGETLRSPYTGQVYNKLSGQLLIRIGRPYLLSSKTIRLLPNKSLVRRDDILATLIYEKLKTTDIVQGLPKVEELLEARMTPHTAQLSPCSGYAYVHKNRIVILDLENNEEGAVEISINNPPKFRFKNGDYIEVSEPLTYGSVNPHVKLTTLFEYYKTKYDLVTACRQSIKLVQLFIVHEIQKTYLAQGVQIADKHIEVIVRQMTSRVYVENSGQTTLLPGELLDLRKAESITQIAIQQGEIAPSYKPVLLGITKASLNSDSFISAASFQETTRVLTEAAIEGKKDWLNGLKENVIIGRLIPAGTGFNYAENRSMLEREKQELEKFFSTKAPSFENDDLKGLTSTID